MKISTMGIDWAKAVLRVQAIDQPSQVVQGDKLRRGPRVAYCSHLEPGWMAREACASARYWARKLGSRGPTVQLMAPQLVKPHGKANQNDRADAEAIREAVTRPTTRFVAIQNVERPTMLSVPRVRRLRVAERPAPAHPIRGLLSEFGIVIPQAIHSIGKPIQAILEAAENEPTRVMRERILGGYDRLKRLTEALDEHEKPIRLWHKGNEWRAKREAIPGIGPRTARALVASLGHALDFKNGGRLAAFIGLVPRQPSSGGQQNLPGIGKRGDVYRRAPLIHGARAVIRFADTKTDKDPWLEGLMRRRNKNMASVALANKQVRTMGALPTQGGAFDRHYVSTPPAARAAGKIRFQGCKPASTVRRRPRRNGTGDPSIWRKRSDRE